MKLRELLNIVGEMSRVQSFSLYPVNPENTYDMINVEWVEDDLDGAGPEYEFLIGTHWREHIYPIPREGEPDPEDLKEFNIDWESENWAVESYDLVWFREKLDRYDELCKQIEKDQEVQK